MSKKPVIVNIEGNVGVGKSTLLKSFEDSGVLNDVLVDKRIAHIYEPVDFWINYKDNKNIDILDHFYRDQSKYGFSFQWLVFMSRLKEIKKHIDDGYDIIIVERSIFTDRNVFMKSLYTQDKITDMEHKIYMDWFEWVANNFELPEQKFMYLELSTEGCYERILNRDRTAEKTIDYSYLDLLNNNHNVWLKDMSDSDCLILDGTYDNKNEKDVHDMHGKIKDFILTHI
jgi:deoxyadenosine/deoxycytidine kinase